MGYFTHKRYRLMVLIIMCMKTVNGESDCSKEDELYVIRSVSSGLVLDASEPDQIQIQYFTGFAQQLWRFERGTHAGLFRIVNNATGTPLDYHYYLDNWYGLNVNASTEQEFFINAKGTITNVNTSWNFDILQNHTVPGTFVGLYKEDGNLAQQFTLQEKMLLAKHEP
ncbi:hypothetical protein Zmor_019853 [Zophobas morio]|uniref:Ricin B lectin domain-containing protein n=1 Tax=Zophobas morio TaxID=2755281 RepID=A0AA38I2K4_9CUCU|nr:hypothetical protein Zmor_019853 [Zophobas morio]